MAFLKGLAGEISVKNPGMMTLIGFAISVAYIIKRSHCFWITGMDFFGSSPH
jgi:Cu2+-exporting ATPase